MTDAEQTGTSAQMQMLELADYIESRGEVLLSYENDPVIVAALRTAASQDAREAVDNHHPVRSTLRKLEVDLRACAVALGEGDDLGAVLVGYADAATAALARAASQAARPGADAVALADALEARWDANETESNPLANGKMIRIGYGELDKITAALRAQPSLGVLTGFDVCRTGRRGRRSYLDLNLRLLGLPHVCLRMPVIRGWTVH